MIRDGRRRWSTTSPTPGRDRRVGARTEISVASSWTSPKNPCTDPRFTDFRNYPAEMWAKPGEKQPNRAALAQVGRLGQRVLPARTTAARCSSRMCADLADSTNIAGFAKDWGEHARAGAGTTASKNLDGVLLPQEITEFTNAGIATGIASVNFSRTPYEDFNGFYAACSTYGSFVLPEVRADAPLQPARPGLADQGRQGALDRRAQRARDRRGLAHPLRHLRAGRDAALPRRPRDRPAPVGVQRGAGGARGGAAHRARRSSRCT